MEKESLLTIKEAAKFLKVSEPTIWRFLKDGKLRRIKLGTKTTRVLKEDIEKLIHNSLEDNDII